MVQIGRDRSPIKRARNLFSEAAFPSPAEAVYRDNPRHHPTRGSARADLGDDPRKERLEAVAGRRTFR